MKAIRLITFLGSLFLGTFCFAQTNPEHVYVMPYIRSDGTFVQGHYRTSPNETNRDNFSTIGNTNPYTGRPGWIQPDNYYSYSDSDRSFQRASDELRSGNYESAINYSNNINDELASSLIKFRAYHGIGDYQNALLYAKNARDKAENREQLESLNEWVSALAEMANAKEELEVKSNRFMAFMELEEYQEAVNVAKSIQSNSLQNLKNLYLATVYEQLGEFEKAIHHYMNCISLETDQDVITGYKNRIEYCRNIVKYPKANENFDNKNMSEILLYHAKEEYSTLDSFLRQYGFRVLPTEDPNTRVAYERITSNPEKFEILTFTDIQVHERTIKLVSLEHSSFKYHDELSRQLTYYKYRRTNVQGLLKYWMTNETAFEFLILFDGFRTDQPEIFVFGGYLTLANGNVLNLNLEKFGGN
ncbi:hypothetical protein [Marinoscillum furvescens]|nr:hypothetical protein [Marinoscillum furvescens]